MTRVLLVLALPAALAACSGAHGHPEEFPQYFPGIAPETRQERTARKEIVHWGSNPKDKKRIGFFHTYETLPQGSRTIRESHYIMDLTGSRRVGFVTAEGKFHRFTKDGMEFVGEYPILTGLKVFYGFPIKDNIDLEDIDPHK